MKNKKVWIVGLIIGILLMFISVAMAWIPASRTNIIGGAGWPTFLCFFRTTGADRLAFIAAILTVVSAVGLMLRKK